MGDADAVGHAEAVLDGQTAAGVDQRYSVCAGQLDGKAGRHQHPLHGLDGQRLIQHGAQVGSGRAGGGVGGRPGAGV